MASLNLLRTRPLFSVGIGLGISSLFATQALYRQRPLLCEGPGATPMNTVSESFKTYSRDAKVPIFKDGRPNPAAYRQLSAGSIIGMCDNLALQVRMMLHEGRTLTACRTAGRSGCEYIFEDAGAFVWDLACWRPGKMSGLNENERMPGLSVHIVPGFERIQHYSNFKDTKVCEGNRSAVRDRRQCGIQA